MKLFTVGPVACYPEVLEVMKHQMFSHRSEEYKKLHLETVELLKEFLETENEIFLFPSSGTGVMEASVRNCVKRKMLVCVCGSFGERYVEVGRTNGKEVEVLRTDLGEPITPDILDEKLAKCRDVEAVAITHNETSVGLINPLKELAEIVKKHGKLLFVDAVSSMGGVDIKVDEWGIDICFSSSQKCFGIPPGLAVGSVSREALKKAEEVENRGWYFDFKLFEKYQRRAGTPTTPPIPQIFGLNKILHLIEEWGGKYRYFQLYAERNRKIRMGIEKLGLNLFPKRGYESPTVSCVKAPKNIGGEEIYEKMRSKGFELAKGYGPLKTSTFRIGNMGYIEFKDIDEMLEALETVLAELKEN
ncbi:MAG: alanine--glyoxylate aminotransferase family protein [archaeon GB-1845-036]|nr:alanine--glyoxylate aminotransferase family protein [Candidatus Culexmicrobium thermophilum]RLE54827.1 MAG: aspartate aminotransferase [Candidatus Verstraetearchaeota archaeon]